MPKNYDTEMIGLDGKALVDTQAKPLIAKDLIINALVYPEDKVEAKERIRRGLLAEKLYVGGEIDFDPSEITLFKELTDKLYSSPILTLALWRFLGFEK